MKKDAVQRFLPIVPALVAFGVICASLWFIQDDAYISYRYVANYLNGHGLVFNAGEFVEGITNHGWTVLMIFFGSLGLAYIPISQVLGGLFGMGTIVVAYLTAQKAFGEKGNLYAVLATYLVGFNLSLGYWAIAGLETGAFTFAAVLSLYWYLTRSRWLVAGLLWAVWLRPEGGLVTGLLILIEAIVERRIPWFTLRSTAIAFVLSLPLVLFKISYYGSLFPNPLHAKTGWGLANFSNFDALVDQLANGGEYTWTFLSQYAFWGIGFLVPLVLRKRFPKQFWAIYLFVALYTGYITFMGGDVLKVHRFFLPLFGGSAIMLAGGIWAIFKETKFKTQLMVIVLAGLTTLPLTLYLPYDFVEYYNSNEKLFTQKMQFQAEQLKAYDASDFSVALATIGIFGYTLLDHPIIDMLGLTDSTIAKHSEDPIPGMVTTWKEQKHNSRYLLTRGPDYIVFSTGIKPSAPAERALLLYPQFVNCYRTRGWLYSPDSTKYQAVVLSIFKKSCELVPPFEPTYPVGYVEEYKAGLDLYVQRQWVQALRHLNKSVEICPEPVNPYVLYIKGFCQMSAGQHDSAMATFRRVLVQDSLVFEAHRDLYQYSVFFGDDSTAAIHERWLKQLVPWYWPKIERTAAAMRADALQQQNMIQQQRK